MSVPMAGGLVRSGICTHLHAPAAKSIARADSASSLPQWRVSRYPNFDRALKSGGPMMSHRLVSGSHGMHTNDEEASSNGAASSTTPFHLAIPVHDIQAAREFFGGILGCPEGRSSKTWVDFNLFGHQVVCHEVHNYNASATANAVDGDPVPVPHFGLAMSVPDFLALADRVRVAGIEFIIEPHIRFKGQPGEQWTMFFKDRSGNSLEFKAMTNPNNLFAKYIV